MALGLDIVIRLGLFVLALMLFWNLLKRYVMMVVLTIFSPFFFLAGAIPGFEEATASWFRRMAAVVITFPIILALVYLAVALLGGLGGAFGGGGVGNPLVGGGIGAPPPVGDANYFVNIATLAGIGIIYFANQVPGMVDELLGTKGPREKGVSPLLLISGGMAALQTFGTISKAAPSAGYWLRGGAYYKGLRGTAQGLAYSTMNLFAGGFGKGNSPSELIKARKNQPQPRRGEGVNQILVPGEEEQSGVEGPPPENPPEQTTPSGAGNNPYRPNGPNNT